jgi:prenylated cyclic peptide (anacyclamide/piricyclamide family)
MKTKKLTPRNSAPVQRAINTTSSESGMGLTPLGYPVPWIPFAGDDAE